MPSFEAGAPEVAENMNESRVSERVVRSKSTVVKKYVDDNTVR